MKSMFLFFFLVLSANAFASNGRAYGLLNTSTSFADHGTADGIGAHIEANMEGEGYGLGAEYKFDLPKNKISFRVGLIYEFERKVDQLTTFISAYEDENGDYVNGDIESSKKNMPKIQMTTFYSNLHFEITQNIALVGGLGYYSPRVITNGTYDLDSGFGHQFGVDFKLPDNFFVQILRRRIILDSSGGIHKGSADLSNLSLLVGKEF